MPKFFLTALILLPNALYAGTLGVTLYSGENQTGSERRIVVGEYLLGTTYLPENRGGDFDPFLPVGEENARSISVDKGTCVILSEHGSFGGEWLVLSAGKYQNLGKLAGKVSSLVAFEDHSGFCFAERDIPMLYEHDDLRGWRFPLVVPAPVSLDVGGIALTQSYVRWGNSLLLTRGRGFTRKASSLYLPPCYSVTLTDQDRRLVLSDKVFGQYGVYRKLSKYDANDSAVYANVELDQKCLQQHKKPMIIPLPLG